MEQNKQVIEKFYNAFNRLDYKTMNSCYSDDILFSDPVFGLLQGNEARAMWEMLCKNAKDFSLTYADITQLDEEYCTCSWVATYTFSKTGKKVTNRIKAYMRIADGKIIEHSDGFSIYTWSRQAFGITGLLIGWTSFFQNKIRKQARKNLDFFINSSL